MKIEDLSNKTLERLRQAHLAMTKAALVQVFEKSETDAVKIIGALEESYAGASPREKNLLLHNDPVALACNLVNCKSSEVPQDRLAKFNEARRASLEQQLGLF